MQLCATESIASVCMFGNFRVERDLLPRHEVRADVTYFNVGQPVPEALNSPMLFVLFVVSSIIECTDPLWNSAKIDASQKIKFLDVCDRHVKQFRWKTSSVGMKGISALESLSAIQNDENHCLLFSFMVSNGDYI